MFIWILDEYKPSPDFGFIDIITEIETKNKTELKIKSIQTKLFSDWKVYRKRNSTKFLAQVK